MHPEVYNFMQIHYGVAKYCSDILSYNTLIDTPIQKTLEAGYLGKI